MTLCNPPEQDFVFHRLYELIRDESKAVDRHVEAQMTWVHGLVGGLFASDDFC